MNWKQFLLDYYLFIRISFGVVATIGLYSILYRETKIYRFFEHLYLGLAAGFTLVATWKDTLYTEWWIKMTGRIDPGTGEILSQGAWIYAALVPIGLMGYMVFSKKHNWMSRIPIGIILGIWSGQQVSIWWQTWGPQIQSSILPIIPTDYSLQPAAFTIVNGERVARTAEDMAVINSNLYISDALTNLIFIITLLSAFSYFIFSYELKGKVMHGVNKLGRWMLMIGFGAMFGSTVMARFSLVIDRMYFIFIEWFASFPKGG